MDLSLEDIESWWCWNKSIEEEGIKALKAESGVAKACDWNWGRWGGVSFVVK